LTYAAEVFLVFQALHAAKVVYRDLKPENLVFSADGHLKFIDFGFAKVIDDRTYTLCGTPEYLAPEVVKGEGASFVSDWRAFGVLLYEFLVGQSPFCDDNETAMYQRICKGEVVYPPEFDALTIDLFRGLLRVDPSARLGCTAIGAEEIKKHPWFRGINWVKTYNHRYQPPLMSMIEGPGDASNFPDYTECPEYQDMTSGSPVKIHFEGFQKNLIGINRKKYSRGGAVNG
jgi:serine/threonine protein kinase